MEFASAKYDDADAFAANELYQDNGWTDGLPIVPPTDALVRTFLEAARMAPGDVVAAEPDGRSRGGFEPPSEFKSPGTSR
jgi:hypothetical protein